MIAFCGISSFSHRHGYSGQPKEITVREDAPESLRVVALETAYELGVRGVRDIVCRVLRKRPYPDNWSAGNVAREVEFLVYECEWFRVYDIIEAFSKALQTSFEWAAYAEAINSCLIEEGLGWQFVAGKIIARGDEGFAQAVAMAATSLKDDGRPTSSGHIQSAIRALSERPKANTSGAVSHATNAVECLLNDITGEAMTLGKYLDRYPTLLHPALKKALDATYGYASDAGARHGKEGVEPSFEAAQFVVTTCAATCTLLTATNPKKLS